ncbi:Spy/CpxP family protein refolding chaperone [Methylocapsa palsarum]|uniref:LTXXQ motif family protein n=1 Tax=Methylocapsa palsarum TaxID=1612308 RepID=A0A1I3WFE9_9HYPH|nr:Spy/CpxP family protein refolding chaperone [Methylocapsa palsarum]SFK05166.1 LTXXQ motif family protein [Methylocapsa palsarum]
MKTRLPFALALLAFAGSGLAIAAANDPQSSAPAKSENHFEFTPADRAAFFDARVAAIHTGLKLTPDQEKLWPPLEAAVRAAAKAAMERREKWGNAPQSDNMIDRLRKHGEGAVERGQNMQAIAAAAAPLYATLTEDQKHRLPVLMHGMGHGFHRFAMMDGHRAGPMGEHMGDHMGMRGGHEGMEGPGHDGMHGHEGMMEGGPRHGDDGPDDDE